MHDERAVAADDAGWRGVLSPWGAVGLVRGRAGKL